MVTFIFKTLNFKSSYSRLAGYNMSKNCTWLNATHGAGFYFSSSNQSYHYFLGCWSLAKLLLLLKLPVVSNAAAWIDSNGFAKVFYSNCVLFVMKVLHVIGTPVRNFWPRFGPQEVSLMSDTESDDNQPDRSHKYWTINEREWSGTFVLVWHLGDILSNKRDRFRSKKTNKQTKQNKNSR